MKTGFSLLAVVAALLSCGAHAAGLPDWLLGEWTVVKVYQLNDDLARYQRPSAEPVVWLGGKTMTVDADRLSLAGQICTDINVLEKRDVIRHLVKDVKLGAEPEDYGLTPRPGRLPYLDVLCGRSLSEGPDGLDDSHQNYIHWIVIPNGKDKIDLMFLGPCYVELRRKEKPVS